MVERWHLDDGRIRKKNRIIKRKLKQWWSTIPPISITPNWTQMGDGATTYDVGNPGPGLGQDRWIDRVGQKYCNRVHHWPLQTMMHVITWGNLREWHSPYTRNLFMFHYMEKLTPSFFCVCFVDRCFSFFFWPSCSLFFFDRGPGWLNELGSWIS